MRDLGPGFVARAVYVLVLAAGCASNNAAPSSAPAVTAAPPAPLQRQLASSYDAPAGCPTQGDYVQYVESRSLRLRLFAEPVAVQTSGRVRVQIQPDTGTTGWVGALAIEGEAPLEREVRGARCEDVVLALALITVLRLEPNREADAPATGAAATSAPAIGAAATGAAATSAPGAATTNPPPGEPAAESTPATPSSTAAADAAARPPAAAESGSPPSEPAGSAPLETLPEPTASPGAVAGVAAASQAGASDAAEANPGWVLESSVEASAAVNDSPPEELSDGPPLLVEPALAAYAGYAAAPSHAFEAMLRGEARFRPGIASWAAAASLAYGHSSQQNPSVDLDFDSLLAGLSLCPPGLRLSLGIWLQACGEARGGVLAISVTERELPIEGGANVRPWFELGPSVQVGLPLSSRWSLRALSSVTLVLIRDSFDVERVVVDEDGQEQKEYFPLYRPPVASFQLLLGLGYEF